MTRTHASSRRSPASLVAFALSLLCSVACSVAGARIATAQTLSNAQLRATFDARGLRSLTDRTDTRSFALRADDFAITIGAQRIDGRTLAAPKVRTRADMVAYHYRADAFDIDVTYELRADWHFISKQLRVTPRAAQSMRIGEITVFRTTLDETPTDVFTPRSPRPSLGTAEYGGALRFRDQHALLMIAQNPFLHMTVDGSVATLRYTADMSWEPTDGPFVSDRGLIAPVALSGRRLPAHERPEWRASGDSTPGLDEREIETFTAMVRAFLLYKPKDPLNVFVGWCVNDYQIDVGTPAGRDEYRRIFDQASASGAQYVLYAPSNSALSRREQSVDDWSWEHVLWLGLGQQIRRNEWNPRTSPIPPSVSEMVDYARGKQLKLLAYVYPVLPFSQNESWIVPARGDTKRKMANLGNRALQDWLIEELVAFHDRTGVAGYSFDHTFLTFDGASRYAQWYGWRRVMETLRRRIPDIVIDGRQAYHQYGPWSYLAGSYPHPTFNDEQPESFTPYPDLHFDRVSANRERYTAYHYRNYEFTPSELVPGFMTHQTSRSDERDDMPSTKTADRGTVLTSFRARDWDYLGWRYSVLSSIAVAGWNNVLNMLPARDSAENASFGGRDREWLREWLRWTVTNKELLRHTRTILGEPKLGKIDGTSAIIDDHGFVFLFNPDAQRLSARVALDATIGLTTGARVELREVYPLAGRRVGKAGAGFWQRGDTATLTLDGGSAMVFEVVPAPSAITSPVVFGTTGTVTVANGVLSVEGARGEVGTDARVQVALPGAATVTKTSVNGMDIATTRIGNVVEFTVPFAGVPFRQQQPVITWDSTFTGGRVTGSFTIPKRVFDQLRARQAAWPIPWTADDYRSTWLVPERLLLFAPFSQPDDQWEARLLIDGKPVEFRKAYTAVRAVRSTFVGFYADVSLLEPDRTYRVELMLPTLAPGQFRGLYFENVEPEYGSALANRRR